MTGFRQLVLTLLAVAAVLAVASLLPAGQLYYVEGTFAPSFVNKGLEPFSGTIEFPGETVQTGTLKLSLESEQPLVREVPFSMALNLPGSMFQPWDTRLYAGLYDNKPMTMLSLDYDQTAGTVLDSAALDGGGGWDAWLVSFPDFTAGTISYMGTEMPQVNEPSAMALAALGVVVVFGVMRDCQRRR